MTKAAQQQKMQEEVLRKREQELAEREIELVERELNIMILQQIMNKPTPKKRKGKFKKSKLKLLSKSGGKNISQPSGEEFLFVSKARSPEQTPVERDRKKFVLDDPFVFLTKTNLH